MYIYNIHSLGGQCVLWPHIINITRGSKSEDDIIISKRYTYIRIYNFLCDDCPSFFECTPRCAPRSRP